MKKGLLEKLARGSRSFLAGAMALGAVYGCEPGTKPTQKPTANFTANPKDGYAPLNVCFNGSSSQAPGSSIAKYIWRFENGSVDSTSGVNVCHTYENPGNHSAGLTVEDAKGERSSQRLEQIVSRDASPVISIPSFSFNEDESYSLDLAGKITSPIYNANSLTITATSPDLKIVTNLYSERSSVLFYKILYMFQRTGVFIFLIKEIVNAAGYFKPFSQVSAEKGYICYKEIVRIIAVQRFSFACILFFHAEK